MTLKGQTSDANMTVPGTLMYAFSLGDFRSFGSRRSVVLFTLNYTQIRLVSDY